MKSNERRAFHIDIHDGSVANRDESKFDVIFEVRQLIADEFGINKQDEFDEAIEKSSYHFVGTSMIYTEYI